MSENTVKIRLKFDQFEIDYEGPLQFLQDSLSAFMKEVLVLYEDHKDIPPISPLSDTEKTQTTPNKDRKIDLSVDTIASHIQASTGPDLILAACAYLTFVENKNKFSRKEILDRMKDAQNHYKQSMGSNLSEYLKGLVEKKFLNQLSSGSYALNAAKKAEMEKELLD